MAKVIYDERNRIVHYRQPRGQSDSPRQTAQSQHFNKPPEVAMRRKLGHRLRQLRQKRGFTQETLAFETGMHRSWIGQLERGESNATLTTLRFLAEFYGITVSKLFRGIG